MKILITRLTGALLMLAAIGGFLLAGFGLAGIIQIRPIVISFSQTNLETLTDILETTSAGFKMTHSSLSSAKISLEAMQTTLETTGKTIQSTEPLVSSLSDLAAEDLPDTVYSAQKSLDAATGGAQVVDTVLRALSFLPGIHYNPEIPFSTSLKELSASMDGLPQTFIVMEANLQDTGENLKTIQTDLLQVIDALQEIETSLVDAETVIISYQDSISQLQNKLNALEAALPRIINLVSVLGSVFLVWLGIAQIGLLLQGWQLIGVNSNKLPSQLKPEKYKSKKVALDGEETGPPA